MIQSYMSSVRAVHIYKGYNCPALKDGVVEAVIGGAKNRKLGEVRGMRLAMTPELMREFKTSLKEEKMGQFDKRLIWAVATFAFWGSLRIHEILLVEKDKFCPSKTMVWGGNRTKVRMDKG